MSDVTNSPGGQLQSLADGDAAKASAPAAAQAGAQSAAAAPPGPTAEQLALEAGWTMAVLYGIEPNGSGKFPGLPTVNELPAAQRKELELNRLKHLLELLVGTPGFAKSDLPGEVPTPDVSRRVLKELNVKILCALAANRQEILLAYELGRSLRDTAKPPDQPDPLPPETAPSSQTAKPPDQPDPLLPETALSRQFARDRITTLQGWLAALSGEFPQHATAVVAASLGRWAEFVTVTANANANANAPKAKLKNAPKAKLKNGDAADAAISAYLLRQGDLWLMLLTGTRSISGLLTPQGYVAAGELALRRSVTIIRGIVQHYWPALLIGAAALGAALTLAAIYAGGAAKVWTSIAAIAGSLGITARAIASTTTRLAAEAAHPVFTAAEVDVMAWAITTMPPLRMPWLKVRQLRKAGIAATTSLGRV